MQTVSLPYLWTPIMRGKRYAYYRRAGVKVRFPAPDAPGFLAAYAAIHAGADAQHGDWTAVA